MGAQVVGQKQVTIQTIFVVVIVLGTLVLAMSLALARLNAMYDRLVGRPTRERRLTWLRAMGDDNWRDEANRLEGITVLERIVMVIVWVAVIALIGAGVYARREAFLAWFFAFAGSPLVH